MKTKHLPLRACHALSSVQQERPNMLSGMMCTPPLYDLIVWYDAALSRAQLGGLGIAKTHHPITH